MRVGAARSTRDPALARAYQRAYYLRHREQILAYGKAHADRRKETARARYARDPERSKARVLAWFRSHRDVKTAINHRYRAKRAGVGPGTLTAAEWGAIKTSADHRCLACGVQEPVVKLTVDHIVPLSGGGLNVRENVQPLCRPCNDEKADGVTDYRKEAIA